MTFFRDFQNDTLPTFPNAYQEDASTIQNFFSSKFGASETVSKLQEQTFRYLCELADFNAVPITKGTARTHIPSIETVAQAPNSAKDVTININIQLQLPATEDSTIYDKLFYALKKHPFS